MREAHNNENEATTIPLIDLESVSEINIYKKKTMKNIFDTEEKESEKRRHTQFAQ